MAKSKKQIVVTAPVVFKWAVWNPFTPGAAALRYSPDWFRESCRFHLDPQIPASPSIQNARTVIYLMWDGTSCQSYAIEFIGRQHSSNYTGWRADCTAAFFDNDTRRLIEAFVFLGAAPPEKGMVFSGTASYGTGQILGDLPTVAFSTENVGQNRYSVCPENQASPRLFTKCWRVNTCSKCDEITPHVESWVGLLFKRAFPRLNPSQRCLICGTVRHG